MKITCLHGYFKFEESRAGEASDFVSIFGLDLVRVKNYFTFEALEETPNFSIKNGPYLNAVAIKTFSGDPWDVMRANELIYNFNTGLLESIDTITQVVPLDAAGNVYVSPGLILPGSLTDGGLRVTDYAAWFSRDTMRFRYSEVELEN